MGFTSPGPPSPKAHTRTTRIPFWAATFKVSGMRARSSSRYMTDTLAPTKRNDLPSNTRRAPRACTNPAGTPGAESSCALQFKNRIAALAIIMSAATTNVLFPIWVNFKRGRPSVNSSLMLAGKLVASAGAGHTNKAHDGAESPNDDESIEEGENRKGCGGIENIGISKQQKLQVEEQETQGDKRKPPRRSAERARPRKSEDRCH